MGTCAAGIFGKGKWGMKFGCAQIGADNTTEYTHIGVAYVGFLIFLVAGFFFVGILWMAIGQAAMKGVSLPESDFKWACDFLQNDWSNGSSTGLAHGLNSAGMTCGAGCAGGLFLWIFGNGCLKCCGKKK